MLPQHRQTFAAVCSRAKHTFILNPALHGLFPHSEGLKGFERDQQKILESYQENSVRDIPQDIELALTQPGAYKVDLLLLLHI